MKRYKDISVRSKLVAQVALGFILILGFFRFWVVPGIEESFMNEKRDMLKNLVSSANSIYAGYDKMVKDGKLSLEQAQLNARTAIKHMRFDGKNYFFVFTDEKMIIQPSQPKREGKPLGFFKDDNDKLYLEEASNVCKTSGEAFVVYYKAKPNTTLPVPKLSYFKLYENWGWMTGAGIYYDDIEDTLSSINFAFYVALPLILLLIFIYLGYFIDKIALKPVRKLAEVSDKIADGDFSSKFEIDSNDEVGLLSKSMGRMSDSIMNVVLDIRELTENAESGTFSVRGDASKHKGVYSEIILGINKNLDALISPLNIAADYLQKIALGQIPQKITQEYRGDFNAIKNSINQCIDSITSLVGETKRLHDENFKGRIMTRANAEMFQGDYKRIVQGINALLDQMVGLLDNMPVPAQICDDDYNVLFMNRAAKELNRE